VGGGGGPGLGGGVQDLRFQGLPALRRAPTTWSVALNSCQSAHRKALAPQADGLPTRLNGGGDVVVGVSRGG